MPSFTEQGRIVITCSKRIAIFLQREVIELGYTPEEVFTTGVVLTGCLQDCIRLNLSLRCASQVLFSLASFPCASPDQLYNEIINVPWESIFDKDGYFSVKSVVDDPSINNSLFVNVRVKDAIADRFRNKTNGRPNSGPQLDHTVITLFWRNGVAEIFIDTSGQTLSKHGFRKIPGQAPMLESLASATLLASVWNRRSTFINPMCGSSTVAIEAALLATNRRPGLYRDNYAFMHIAGYDQSFYELQKLTLADQVAAVPGLKIIASDISPDAINISRINAGAAGVQDLIEFIVCDFSETPVPQDAEGVVYFNPEYGERMGDSTELEETYRLIGDFLKSKCGGYTGYVFTGNLSLAKKVGLKSRRKIEFYTGKIDCRLLEYELYTGTKRTVKHPGGL